MIFPKDGKDNPYALAVRLAQTLFCFLTPVFAKFNLLSRLGNLPSHITRLLQQYLGRKPEFTGSLIMTVLESIWFLVCECLGIALILPLALWYRQQSLMQHLGGYSHYFFAVWSMAQQYPWIGAAALVIFALVTTWPKAQQTPLNMALPFTQLPIGWEWLIFEALYFTLRAVKLSATIPYQEMLFQVCALTIPFTLCRRIAMGISDRQMGLFQLGSGNRLVCGLLLGQFAAYLASVMSLVFIFGDHYYPCWFATPSLPPAALPLPLMSTALLLKLLSLSARNFLSLTPSRSIVKNSGTSVRSKLPAHQKRSQKGALSLRAPAFKHTFRGITPRHFQIHVSCFSFFGLVLIWVCLSCGDPIFEKVKTFASTLPIF